MLTLESPGQLVRQTFGGQFGTVSILQIGVCGRQPLLWKFKSIGLDNGVSTLLHEYY